MQASTTPTVSVNVTYPGTAGEPSLFDVAVTTPSALNLSGSGTQYDGWCIDMHAEIRVPGTYTAALYSTYETDTLHAAMPGMDTSKLDSINWLLGFYTGSPTDGYTYGDAQAAIWTLLGQDWHAGASVLGAVDQTRVDALVTQALAHDGYVPEAGQTIGVVLDTYDAAGVHQQPIIIETRAAQLGDHVWADSNADGIQDAGEAGIAGATVNLVRDADGNGSISANEVLASATTDANGDYSFKGLTPGLNYQVQFVRPAGYDAESARQSDGDAASGNNSDGLLSDVITLKPGEFNQSIDAGFFQFASIGDRVWLDGNANGLQDSGEAGVVGVTVKLVDSHGQIVATTLSDGNGAYAFNGLVPGQYSVQFITPDGYHLTTAEANGGTTDAQDSDANPLNGLTETYTLTSGQHQNDVDAGLLVNHVPMAHIGDRVFEDTNGNGVQDAGEAGLGGITVNLCDANGQVVATTQTAPGGAYGFDVAPGTYSVQVVAPQGYFLTRADVGADDTVDSDIDAATGKSGLYTLLDGDNNTTVDAGLVRLANLGDTVWLDANGNGVQDTGEAGVGGVTVKLFDAAGAQVATRVTGGDGHYVFTDLTPGSYSVQFVAPTGFMFTTRDAQGNTLDASDSDADASGRTGFYTLPSGGDEFSVDAGLVATPKAHLGDKVFEDKNANGLQDAGEGGIGGVTVTLCDANGNAVGTTTTAADGSYGFDVDAGTYAIKVTAPAGWSTAPVNQGTNDAIDSDIDATGKSGLYILAPGQSDNSADAGLFRKASLGDKVWVDANANGVQDAGEAGLAGVTVQLCDAGGNVVATRTTDASGNYLFDNLTPGTYSVKFVAPAGWVLTGQDAQGNTLDAADSDANTATGKTGNYTLASGESNLTVDAGVYQKAHLGDKVFEDRNANGLQDAGEGGIAGVSVALCDANGNTVATTTTGADGTYGFDVAPGTYAIKVTAPAGYFATVANQGANDAIDSDIDASGKSGTVTLTSGQTDNSVDAGLFRKASLGDKVWLDANGNGLQDTGETGMAGVTVNLCDAAGNIVATKTTDASGNYLFTDLVPGSYSVRFTAPAGYTLTTQDANANASDAIDSDADAATGKTGAYTLASGESNLTVDAGLKAIPKAHLGDKVFEDKNANGLQDAGEGGIGGVSVALCDANGNTVATTTTAADGSYGFDVAAGTYAIKVTAPAGYTVTAKDTGANDANDSDIDATGKSGNYTLAAGEVNNTADAGLYKKASLGDKVWIDANANGLQDAGEAGLANVTVSLCDATGKVIATKTTDASGNYLFTDLVPGTYSVKFSAPTGYDFTLKDAGANAKDTTDSDADTVTGKTANVTLASGEQNLTVDAGLVKCVVNLGDKVFLDANKNGLQDASEAGVAGVQVKLQGAGADGMLGTADDTSRTTTTDSNGNYLFKGVEFGAYKVAITTPDGYATTLANVGADDAKDSDFTTAKVLGPVNLIVNGSFENPITNYGQYASITGWKGIGDTIEVGLAGTYGVGGANGLQVVELDANVKGAGTGLYQDVQTTVGQSYQLSLDVAARANTALATNTVEVWWAGCKVATIDPGSTTLSTYNLTVKGSGGLDRLEFREQGGDDNGVGGIIDNVRLVTCATITETAPIIVNACVDNLTIDAGLVAMHKPGIDVQKYVSAASNTSNQATGTEGANCSYWKSAFSWNMSTGANEWTGTGCKTTDTFNQLFGCNVSGGTKTIQQLLSTTTGGQEGLMREACAAYLNACHGSVDYAYTKDQVCAETRYALSSGNLQQLNDEFGARNNLGCNWSTAKTTYTNVVDTALYDADAPPGLELTVGGTAVFTYIVKNTGDAALKNVSLTDDRIPTVTYVGGDVNSNGLLDVNETWTYNAKETVQAGTIKNIGTVTATDTVDGYTNVSAQDPAYYTGTSVTPSTKGSIGDKVWEDKNFNGVQDAGEAGIGGVKVVLKGAGLDGVFGTKDDITSTTSTAANGGYEFTNLAAGKYQVQVTAPGGYTATKANVGANDAVDSDIDATGSSAVITLAAGEHNLTVDAGLYRKASVGDFVWQDSNHNWLQDAGECGIGGITVKLLNSTGGLVATTKTDATGHYLFANLDPGVYQLQFDKTNVLYANTNMNLWKWAVKDAGTNDAVDSDVNGDGVATTNVTVTDKFTLVSGQADMTRDAAITPIVIDLDGNGIHTVARADSGGAFDLLGNGHAIQSGWVSGGDGFLAVDRNGNGRIDSINELFGGNAKGAGYAQLAAFDSNHDGHVDSLDAQFGQLMIWRDANGNHQTDAGELVSLSQAGVASLAVAHTNSFTLDGQGNVLGETSSATLANGHSVQMTDVYFNVSAADAKAAGVALPTIADMLGDDRSLDSVLGHSAPQPATVAKADAHADQCGGEAAEVLRKLHAVSHEEHGAAA